MPMYDPPIAHYAHINVSNVPEQTMFKVIGKEGHNMKRLTAKYNLKYLWWNMENKTLEIWGGHNAVANARPKLEKFIEYAMEEK